MSFFTAENICAGYGGKSVLCGVSFTAEKGHLLGVLGANGSGKTTLLKSICGILPHTGRCTLDGLDLGAQSPRRLAQLCSYIPQRSGITIDISVRDVVLMGFNPRLGLLEHPTAVMKESADRTLAEVGLCGREEENYLHLSEGQKQLCILARTLVSESTLLLLDEPESALDLRFRWRMLTLLRTRVKDGERAAVVALHDPSLALNCCDELLVLDGGRCLGTVRPDSDPPEEAERMLSAIYGPVSLNICRDRTGTEHRIMLKHREESL